MYTSSLIVPVTAMANADEANGFSLLFTMDVLTTLLLSIVVVLITTCWMCKCMWYRGTSVSSAELTQPSSESETERSEEKEHKIGRNKMEPVIFEPVALDDWDPLGLTKRCRVIQYDTMRRLSVCSQPHCPGSDFCNVHKDWRGNMQISFEPTMGSLGVNPEDVSYHVGWVLLENEKRAVWRKKLPYVNNAPLKRMCIDLGIDVAGVNAPKHKSDLVIRLLQVVKHPNFVKVVSHYIREEKLRQQKLTSDELNR